MSEKRDETESETIYKDVSLIPKQLSKSQYKRAVVNCRQAKWEGSPGESLKGKETLVEGKKEKVAILISYSGADYYGLAHNKSDHEHVTIEQRVFEALIAARVVYSNVLSDRKRCSYQSCSRTDKGVSAIGNVASLKCINPSNLTDLVNAHLPADIRITGVRRVTKGFCAKNRCTHRTYSYYCPTVCFAERETWNEPNVKDYRISGEKLDQVNSLLSGYVGTKAYHNFTSGKQKGDMSAQRHIISFGTHDVPFIKQEWEYVELRVKGQSFMIHQIRKMIGLVIARASGWCGDDHVERAFNSGFEDIPKAPGNGLVLRQVHYDIYNKDYGAAKGNLEWTAEQADMDKFAREKILPYIFMKDIEEGNMTTWLSAMSAHDFTGVRAKAQWEKWQEEKKSGKRKIEKAEEGAVDSKIVKKD